MVYAKPIAFITLILMAAAGFSATADEGSVAVPHTHARKPALISTYFVAGMAFWRENLRFIAPDKSSTGLSSSVQALTLGYHVKFIKRGWGLLTEAQGLLGQAQSADDGSMRKAGARRRTD